MAQLPGNFYSNPAFCQQSEFYHKLQLSPQHRKSPLGAQQAYEEQEFYEEVLVDDSGLVKDQKVLVLSQNNDGKQYIQMPGGPGGKVPPQKHRYEYIPMQEAHYHQSGPSVKPTSPSRSATTGSRYALVPVEDLTSVVSPVASGRYELVDNAKPPSRYEYIASPPSTPSKIQQLSPRSATQKLHELLSTPKKPANSPNRRVVPRTLSPPRSNLNYALASRPIKTNTAVVNPMLTAPSVYAETTFSCSDSGLRKAPVQATLAVAAVMMLLCGGVSTGLCFYMISIMGRLYFLDFGIVAGFTCLVLGLLGFRTRNCFWLPNRNYISGYIMLSVFSLLTCAALLVLLVMQPKAGTALADMTSGAVCGISVLSLVLATTGVVASYCCRVPPPDNRVQHCAPGFVV